MEEKEKLPVSESDRVTGEFYIYQGKKRYWTGTKLYCPHKKPEFRCNLCREEKKKKEEEKKDLLPGGIPDDPGKTNRIIGERYIYDFEVRIWNGKRFHCFHDLQVSKCKKPHDIAEYEKIGKKEEIKEEIDDFENIEDAPEPDKRVIGKKYIYKDDIRIWNGIRFYCKHNHSIYGCGKCKKRGKSRIILPPKRKEKRIDGQFYLYKNCVCVWKEEWFCGFHNLKYSECEECINEKVKTLPKLKKERTNGATYIYDGRICYWIENGLKCEHFGRFTRCVECEGGSICNEHKKLRSRCIECSGSELCSCGTRKEYCKYHGGNSICKDHGMRNHRCTGDGCKNGGGVCKDHKKRQNSCIKCEGSQICPHKTYMQICKLCNGSRICLHKTYKEICRICGDGSKLCKNCKYTIYSTYKPYCSPCYYYLNPDLKKPNRHRNKEWYVNKFLTNNFEGIKFRHNLSVDGGCSKKRPDWFYDCLTHSVIIELDESRHINYNCENKRVMELFQDLGNRPLIVIRLNPDKYQYHEGCFYYDTPTSNILRIREKEWIERSNKLIESINFHIKTIPTKEFTETKLFF